MTHHLTTALVNFSFYSYDKLSTYDSLPKMISEANRGETCGVPYVILSIRMQIAQEPEALKYSVRYMRMD